MVAYFVERILLVSTGYPVEARAEKEGFDIVGSTQHLQNRTRHLIDKKCTYTYSGLALWLELVVPKLSFVCRSHHELSRIVPKYPILHYINPEYGAGVVFTPHSPRYSTFCNRLDSPIEEMRLRVGSPLFTDSTVIMFTGANDFVVLGIDYLFMFLVFV